MEMYTTDLGSVPTLYCLLKKDQMPYTGSPTRELSQFGIRTVQ